MPILLSYVIVVSTEEHRVECIFFYFFLVHDLCSNSKIVLKKYM